MLYFCSADGAPTTGWLACMTAGLAVLIPQSSEYAVSSVANMLAPSVRVVLTQIVQMKVAASRTLQRMRLARYRA